MLALFFNCTKEYEVPDDLVLRDFVWKGLNAYYLHQDQIEDLSDRRFNSDQEINTYLNTFETESDLFANLLLAGDTKSNILEDYNIIFDEAPINQVNGFEFGAILEPGSTENIVAFVYYVLPNSDAELKNLTRGEFFNTVNGTQLTVTNYENLLLNNTSDYTLGMVNFDGITVTPNGKSVTLKKESYDVLPIFLEKVIPVATDNVGYLMYNNNFSGDYITDLNNAFLNIKNQSVNKLIIDFRYNIGSGGFAKNITQIASMINGDFIDEIAIKEEWNTKAQSWFLANQPDSIVTKFPTRLNISTEINSVQLTDVYFILNGNNFSGSSAIELLMNSLKPYINVHIIGNQTIGNNTGSITLYNSEDYNFANRNMSHTVALQPIVLTFLNNSDETYANGFSPNIDLCANEDILNLGVLGERSDPLLDRVLNYISSGNIGNSTCDQDNFEYVCNTVAAQREIDNGVFINQHLPNTN